MTIKLVTPKNILIAALVVVVLFLLFKTCNPPKPALVDKVPTVKEQKESVKVDSIASKKYNDSVPVSYTHLTLPTNREV